MNPGLIWEHNRAPHCHFSVPSGDQSPKRTLLGFGSPQGHIYAHKHTQAHTPGKLLGLRQSQDSDSGSRPALQPPGDVVARGTEPPAYRKGSLSEAVSQLLAVQLPLWFQAPLKLHSRLPVDTPALSALPIQSRVALPRQGHKRSVPRQPVPSHNSSSAPNSNRDSKMAPEGGSSFLNKGPLSSLERREFSQEGKVQ